jgi:hypothetical protein
MLLTLETFRKGSHTEVTKPLLDPVEPEKIKNPSEYILF